MSRALFVINPAGQGGAGTRAWEAFTNRWPDPIDPADAIVTERPGHAREIVASAEGYGTFVAVGGDGTVGEVMSGMMHREESDLKLAIVPAGTGNDIARNAGISSIDHAIRALRNGHTRAFDMIRVESRVDGRPVSTCGFLCTAVGFSAIPKIRPCMKRLLGPKGAYYLACLLQLISYQPTSMTLRTEQGERSGRTWLVLVGNTESTAGGSMRLAPGARIDEGELNVSVFPGGSRIGMAVGMMPKIASGEHVNAPGVAYFPAKRVEIESEPPAVVDLDGDLRGTTPATIVVCPQAVTIAVPEPPATETGQP